MVPFVDCARIKKNVEKCFALLDLVGPKADTCVWLEGLSLERFHNFRGSSETTIENEDDPSYLEEAYEEGP